MGDLLIRNIPDAMKADLAERAAKNGRSLSEEAKVRIGRSLHANAEEPAREFANAYEAIRSVFEKNDAIGDEFADLMDEIEAERKWEFGRPPSDLE